MILQIVRGLFVMKSVQHAIQDRFYDERKDMPVKCRNCIWRRGRVCLLVKCVKDD